MEPLVKTPWEKFLDSPMVKVGERVIDLSEMKPLTIADKKSLRKDTQLTMADMQHDDPEVQAKFCWWVLKKFCPDLVLEEVDQVTAQDAQFIERFVAKRIQEVDRPTSARSISSPAPTVGPETT